MSNTDTPNGRRLWPAVAHTTRGRCPRCGEGRLFAGYLKPVAQCAACGEALGHIRAEDGPAWLTILLVGHILAPVLLNVVPRLPWSEWVILAGLLPLTLILTLSLLPYSKGFFIGLIWHSGSPGPTR